MHHLIDHFPPTQAAAQARLAAFLPRAGRAYTQERNYDLGPDARDNVSMLSPYLRVGLLDEAAVARAVLTQHSPAQADSFLAEVFWRTYWKGWLELRPTVWTSYLNDIKRLKDDVQTQSGLRNRWEAACLGQTGLAPFDAWAQELVQTGYLHNHARMWFASIWIFTLDLPWQLGADFFLRHLLDGDAASNTLGWRWVAGIQTAGKTYLATAENIEKFTRGRFSQITGLAPRAQALPAPSHPDPLPVPFYAPPPAGTRIGVVLHSDDVAAAPLVARGPTPVAWAFLDASAAQSPWQMAPHIGTFRHRAAQDQTPPDKALTTLHTAADIHTWAKAHGLDQILLPYAPVGANADCLRHYGQFADALSRDVRRRPLDTKAWPLATKGFFKFRQHIPDLISHCANAPGLQG